MMFFKKKVPKSEVKPEKLGKNPVKRRPNSAQMGRDALLFPPRKKNMKPKKKEKRSPQRRD